MGFNSGFKGLICWALEIGGENGKIGTNVRQMTKTIAPVEEENEDEQKQKTMMIRNANYNTR